MIFPIKVPISSPENEQLTTRIRASYTKILKRKNELNPKLLMTEISLAYSKILALILELKLKKHKPIAIIHTIPKILSNLF